MKTAHQRDAWLALLGRSEGRELTGIRPLMLVSNDEYNALPDGMIIGVPLTRTNRELTFHPLITAPEGSLTNNCVAMCNQVRAYSATRLRTSRGQVSPQTLDSIVHILQEMIAVTPAPRSLQPILASPCPQPSRHGTC